MSNKLRHPALFFSVILILILGNANAQDKISILATDKLMITADAYVVNDTLPYMILCHDIKSSRGEYKDLAHRFTKLGYNCLAIDMRIGAAKNGVDNETAALAQAKHFKVKLLDPEMDIDAAINYCFTKSHKKVVLVGSGYSASLVLFIGSTNTKVATVLAFSPGELFAGLLDTKTAFPKCAIPVFVASSRAEAEATKKYVAAIPAAKMALFSPSTDGAHGTDALLNTTPDHHDYWLSILMYIRQLQGGG